SKSSKIQFSRRPNAAPTLLLPAPIKPTRNTASGAEACNRSAEPVRTRGLALTVFVERLFKRSRHCQCYFVARFLRWILPLKLRSTTVEETAARPIVPQKALPSLSTKEVCCLG